MTNIYIEKGNDKLEKIKIKGLYIIKNTVSIYKINICIGEGKKELKISKLEIRF